MLPSRSRRWPVTEITAAPIDPSVVTLGCMGVCSSCGELTNFSYRGIQEVEDGEPGFSLWNCCSCGSTVSGTHVLTAEVERAMVAEARMGVSYA